jgi:hypothetical protein
MSNRQELFRPYFSKAVKSLSSRPKLQIGKAIGLNQPFVAQCALLLLVRRKGRIHTRTSQAVFVLLRFVREGINTFFPLAVLGGDVIGARLLAQFQHALVTLFDYAFSGGQS